MGEQTNQPDFSDVRATVSTTPSDPAARADFGHVDSRVSSTVDESTNYIVVEGDSLSKIAQHFYGSAHAWKSIFEANRGLLSDPDHIKPGQALRIPPKP